MEKSQPLIFEQSPIIKYIGYFCLAMGVIFVFVLIAYLEFSKFDNTHLLALILVLLVSVWLFIVLPIKAFTMKKRLVIQGDEFLFESNKKEDSINTNFKELIWWRKNPEMRLGMEGSTLIQVKFKSKEVFLDSWELDKFEELELFFEKNFKDRKKKPGH